MDNCRVEKGASGSAEERVTAYQELVYGLCRRIPRGRVVSYRELTRAAGRGSPRSAGQALKRNPYAPEVPCHRVVASDGGVGGFAGQRGGGEVRRKIRLLEEEGVRFDAVGRVKRGFMWEFSLAKEEDGD